MLGLLDLSGLYGVIGGAVLIVLGIFGAWARGRWTGKRDEQNRRDQDTIDRLEAGRDAVRDGRGRDPADRLRQNDGKW